MNENILLYFRKFQGKIDLTWVTFFTSFLIYNNNSVQFKSNDFNQAKLQNTFFLKHSPYEHKS